MFAQTLLRALALVLLFAIMTACAPFKSQEDQQGAALNNFIKGLRWHQYDMAARYIAPPNRNRFLDQMSGLNDLTVTDVRMVRLDFAADGKSAEARLEMDYYLLPSATIKTLRFNQTWVRFENDASGQTGFMITSPFPKIP